MRSILIPLSLLTVTTTGRAQCEPVLPDVHLDVDCASGATLRWNGLFQYGYQSIPSPCGGPYVYSLGNGVSYAWGDVMTDWVQESATSWRYNAPLPAGSYYVFIRPASAAVPPVSPDCDIYSGICLASCSSVCYTDAQFTVPLSPGDCGVNVSVRAWLGGALPSGALMSDAMRSGGLVPITEPYSALGYNYVGSTPGATIPPALLAVTGSNAVVDWVVLELRSDPSTIVWSKPAMLRRNGQLMDLDGDGYVNFPVNAGNYWLAIRHRNHLGVMTGHSWALSDIPVLLDLGAAATVTFGSAARTFNGSVHCLWPGDANGDGVVKYTGGGNDRDAILTAIGGGTPTNTVNNVYDRRDVNLDGSIKYTGSNNDRDLILQMIGGTVPTATRVQQLP